MSLVSKSHASNPLSCWACACWECADQPKSQLDGFYDPCCGATKGLLVRYEFKVCPNYTCHVVTPLRRVFRVLRLSGTASGAPLFSPVNQYKLHQVLIDDCEKLRMPLAKHALRESSAPLPDGKRGVLSESTATNLDDSCASIHPNLLAAENGPRRVSVKPFRVSLSHKQQHPDISVLGAAMASASGNCDPSAAWDSKYVPGDGLFAANQHSGRGVGAAPTFGVAFGTVHSGAGDENTIPGYVTLGWCTQYYGHHGTGIVLNTGIIVCFLLPASPFPAQVRRLEADYAVTM